MVSVLVEQRSARLPVTQEVVGSNPIGDAKGRRSFSEISTLASCFR